jgi:hypothetical protein
LRIEIVEGGGEGRAHGIEKQFQGTVDHRGHGGRAVGQGKSVGLEGGKSETEREGRKKGRGLM